MVVALRGTGQPLNRIPLCVSPEMKGLHGFVTASTRHFYKILYLSEELLQIDPSEWLLQKSYLKDQIIATSVRVENGLAEWGVA